MEFKDASSDIAEISKDYQFDPAPNWLVRIQELIQQALLALQQFLDSLFQTRHSAASDSRSLSTFMQLALCLAGAIALVFIIYFLWKRVKQVAEEKISSKRGASAIEKILDSAGYRQEAETLAQDGNYRSACRALYLCLLQLMHEKNVTPFAPAKTNYEYRYLLASYGKVQEGFKKLAEIVELVWFGNKEANRIDYEECIAILLSLEPEIEKISAEKARLAAEAAASV